MLSPSHHKAAPDPSARQPASTPATKVARPARKRPAMVSASCGVVALLATGAVEYVVADHAFHAANTLQWGVAFVVTSVCFALVSLFGPRVLFYLVSRGAWGGAILAAIGVLGCLCWSGWQLSGALALADAKARASAFRGTDEFAFAKAQLARADAELARLDEEERAIDVRGIMDKAAADAQREAALRDEHRRQLKAERWRLDRQIAAADAVAEPETVALAQRRLRGVDAELHALFDSRVASEPVRAAEVTIAALRAGVESRRARALLDRERYLPDVRKGALGAYTRSVENFGLAALILALVVVTGSGFEIPSHSPSEIEVMRLERDRRRQRDRRERARREAQGLLPGLRVLIGLAAAPAEKAAAAAEPTRPPAAPVASDSPEKKPGAKEPPRQAQARLGRSLADLLANPRDANAA